MSPISRLTTSVIGLAVLASGALTLTLSGTTPVAPSLVGPQHLSSHTATANDRVADALLSQSRAAGLAAKSVRIVGTVPSQKAVLVSVMTRDGRAHSLLRQGESRVETIRIGALSYTKANLAYLFAHGITGAQAQAIAGKWLRSSTELASPLALDMKKFIVTASTAVGEARISGRGQAQGRAVTFVRDAQENGTIAVRASGDLLLVQVDYDDPGMGYVRFSRWGAKVLIAPPKNFVVVRTPTTSRAPALRLL